MSDYQYDVLVIGAGPGGYVAAIRASQLGLKAAVVEKDQPGGVCLNWGCIPSKALIRQAELVHDSAALADMGASVDLSSIDYGKVHKKSRQAASKLSKGIQFLLKKNNVEYITGTAEFKSAHEVVIDGKDAVTAANVIIATGSRPREVPGFAFDQDRVISSRDILALNSLPKSLIILGAGAIGMEFAYVMNAFGVEVTVVEMLDQLLPLEDADSVSVVEKAFKRYGIVTRTGTRATKLATTAKGVTVTVEDSSGKTEDLSAEKLLVAVGRAPNSEGLGLDRVGVQVDRGFIVVGDYYRTAVDTIFAIGDVVATPLLAHVASKEGEIAVETIAGHDPEPRIGDGLIPGAVYCEPQVGSFGLTEKAAREAGRTIETQLFPYRGAGKTVAIDQAEGHVKVIVDAASREILGAHAVGKDATEIIHELLLAKSAELLPEDVATMVHAHPTISEAVMEAARAIEGWAIHA